MKYLTVDFGSTYTKLTAIDSTQERVVGTSSAFTTIETDVCEGFNTALQRLESQIGKFDYDQLVCCSSAAGGLKMVALGLVPELTAKAAKMAASSAGAKVVKTYAYEISQAEQEQIESINPDLVLLCGGTDGGNKEVITANATKLCQIKGDFSVIVAGNKSASYDIEQIFRNSGKECVITENVMPSFNILNIRAAKESITALFIRKIVDAKGLSAIQRMTPHKIIPTPLAVMNGCELLSQGTDMTQGLGEIMAVDLGGATTDIYSMAHGRPTMDNVIEKGLPEPASKRSVEGDLGMRYSLSSLYDQITTHSEEIKSFVDKCTAHPDTLAQTPAEVEIETALAREAVEIATQRHCGYLERTYTPMGEIYTLSGKDLTQIKTVIGIGGAIINNPDPSQILRGVEYNPKDINIMKPKSPDYYTDQKYIFASMGLLSTVDPELALKILKREITKI